MKTTGDARIDELLERVQSTSVGKSVSMSEWCELTDWLADNTYSDVRLSGMLGQAKESGQMTKRNEVVAWLKRLAGEEFSAGNDSLAKLYRNLINQVP